MVTTPTPPPAEPTVTEQRIAAAQVVAAHVIAFTRQALTGDRAGRMRRPALYVIAGAALAVSGSPLGMLGLVALMLLALTDAVTEL
jgi:hypothetical protein